MRARMDHETLRLRHSKWGGWDSNPRPKDYESVPRHPDLSHLVPVERERWPLSTRRTGSVAPDPEWSRSNALAVTRGGPLPSWPLRRHPSICQLLARNPWQGEAAWTTTSTYTVDELEDLGHHHRIATACVSTPEPHDEPATAARDASTSMKPMLSLGPYC